VGDVVADHDASAIEATYHTSMLEARQIDSLPAFSTPWRYQMISKLFKFVVAVVGGIQLLFGYIDPNTGGMLFQMLAVAFTFLSGIFFFFSRQIQSGVARLRRLVRPDKKQTPEQS
jgi:hypothetical protein